MNRKLQYRQIRVAIFTLAVRNEVTTRKLLQIIILTLYNFLWATRQTAQSVLRGRLFSSQLKSIQVYKHNTPERANDFTFMGTTAVCTMFLKRPTEGSTSSVKIKKLLSTVINPKPSSNEYSELSAGPEKSKWRCVYDMTVITTQNPNTYHGTIQDECQCRDTGTASMQSDVKHINKHI